MTPKENSMTVAVQEPTGDVATVGTGPDAILELLRFAIERNIPVEALERLQALHERVSDRVAAAEFAQAVATFQATCPPIGKTSTAEIVTKGGSRFKYAYAELDHIARTIAPLLQRVGLSYAWDSETDGRMLRCTCTLRHINGHTMAARFACPVDSASAMSEQQKHAAALSYARRQSLIQVLGLTTCDPDTDASDPTPITNDQALDLEVMCDDAKVNKARFLEYLGVVSFQAIPAGQYDTAVAAVHAKRAENAKAGR